MKNRKKRALFLIGGASDTVFKDFVRLAGGRKSHFAVITHASSIPEEVGADIEQSLRDCGVTRITVLLPEHKDLPEDVDAIYIGGGDQVRLVERLEASGLGQQVRDAVRRGVLAGTSAGAAAAAFVMIAGSTDDWDKDVIKLGTVLFGKGLGLHSGIIVDTHFGERNRQNRLRTAVGMYDDVVGIGLDEDTACHITGNRCRVYGAGKVWVYTRNGGHDFMSIAVNAKEETYSRGGRFSL
jgi:cyanophycinase